MGKKLVITKEDKTCHVDTDLENHELYEALVALTKYVSATLADPLTIFQISSMACSDAVGMLEDKDPAH